MDENLVTENKLKLSTYTPRVRHLKSLFIRNLSCKCLDVNQLELYFTLHRDSASSGFYKSELLKGTLNPSWNSFDLTFLPCYYTSTNLVCLRIWVQDGDSTPKVHLEYVLDLKALVLAEDEETVHGAESEPPDRPTSDVVTFFMFDEIFEMPLDDSSTQHQYLFLSTNQPPKHSYSLNLLARLQTVLRALKQTEQSVERVREDIQRGLTEIQHITDKQQQIELHRVRIESMKSNLDQRKQTLLQKRSKLYSRRAETNRQEKGMDVSQKLMQEDDSLYTDVKSDYYNSREMLLKANALLSKRHRQMIYELCLIYPIEQMVDGRFTIAGVFLPNPEQVTSQNELASSTALGHCAHLVDTLSRFLQFPLEYPIEYRGSRSLIYDMVRPLSQLPSQKDRAFPLYSRGKDRKLFQYAVFLLNKNIENLRYNFELHTKDRKLTLRNLRDLVHSKFDIGLVTPVGQQESRSPPLPPGVYRTASVPMIKSNSSPGRNQSFNDVSQFSSPADMPSTEESAGEAPARPVSHLVQAHVDVVDYQYDSSSSSNRNMHANGEQGDVLNNSDENDSDNRSRLLPIADTEAEDIKSDTPPQTVNGVVDKDSINTWENLTEGLKALSIEQQHSYSNGIDESEATLDELIQANNQTGTEQT